MRFFFTALLLIGLLVVSCDHKEETANRIYELDQRLKSFEENGDYISATQVCNEILSIDSVHADVFDLRAELYESQYRKDTTSKHLLELALSDMNKAILLNPTSKRYLTRARFFEYLKHDRVSALEDYNLAVNSVNKALENPPLLRVKPEPPIRHPLQIRADFYFDALNDTAHAISDLNQAIQECQGDARASAQRRYAGLLMECSRYSEAEEILLELDDVAFELAICRLELKDYYGALIQLELFGLKSRIAKQLKGYCLAKLGQVEKGKQLIIGNLWQSNSDDPRVTLTEEEKTYLVSEKFFEIFPERKSQNQKYQMKRKACYGGLGRGGGRGNITNL
jgi:tetratricopeptide (TPR) repeat protein